MKSETFYNQTVEELCTWYEAMDTELNRIMKEKEITRQESLYYEFPLNFKPNGNGMSILEIIKPTFVNCLSHIINSYIKYGKKKYNIHLFTKKKNKYDKYIKEKYEKELELLDQFLENLNEIYTKDTPVYQDLAVILAIYFKIIDNRMYDSNVDDVFMLGDVESGSKIIEGVISQGMFLIPTSLGINYFKVIKSYCIPVIFASVTNTMGHFTAFKPHMNFLHDIGHMSSQIKSLHYVDYKDFFIEYEKLHNDKSQDPAFITAMDYLLFGLLHEISGVIYYLIGGMQELYNSSYNKDNISGHEYLLLNFPGNINSESFNYLMIAIVITHVIKQLIESNKFDTHIAQLEIDKTRDIAYFPLSSDKIKLVIKHPTVCKGLLSKCENSKNNSNKANKANKASVNNSGTYMILGNTAHVDYVDIDTFKVVFEKLYDMFDKLGYDAKLFKKSQPETKGKNKGKNKGNKSNISNSKTDPIEKMLVTIRDQDDAMVAKLMNLTKKKIKIIKILLNLINQLNDIFIYNK
jgi:hypothetical protein